MKTRSIIISLALVVLLAGACSVQAEVIRSYDFNGLSNGSIGSQDSWTLMTPGWGATSHLAVGDVVGADENTSKAVYRDTAVHNGTNVGDYRLWSEGPVSFTSTDTAITQSFQLKLAGGENREGVVGGASFYGANYYYNMVFGADCAAGAASGRLHLRNSSAIETYGDSISVNKWYEVKLVMDFSTAGGLGTLWYRDMETPGAVWTKDGTIVDKPLGIAQKTPGVYEVTGLKYRIFEYTLSTSQIGWADNYKLDDPKVPEPSTLALLATGLIGLLAYAWRKRK
ncbi:MAG: PEP-CTERM sorting domain-containing protein [Pirellulales bacterium]|nr:PEP-CTERM sorting domain-containing protein [Pirellulales bacterium]